MAEAAGICYLPSLPFEDFQKQPWATSEVRAGASREAGGRLEPLKTEAGDECEAPSGVCFVDT